MREELIEKAIKVRDSAYAPYSGFKVGVALLAESGKVYVGTNVENASFPVGTCAERSAISAMVAGGDRKIVEIAIATTSEEPVPPCGMCRQALWEFGREAKVILVGASGKQVVLSMPELLPWAFGAHHLGGAKGKPLLLKGGFVLTMDAQGTSGYLDVLVEGGKITGITRAGQGGMRADDVEVIDCTGCVLLPSFVQTHVHLCQTLWRNRADGLSLMGWLRQRTLPLESHLSQEEARISALLGGCELLLGGTTTIADFGTARRTETIVEAALSLGLKGVFSKVIMDDEEEFVGLREAPEKAVEEVLALAQKFKERALLAFAPRFALSCSRHAFEVVAKASREHGMLVHTHCAETEGEVQDTVRRFGLRPVALYDELGLLGNRLLLAHCVHLDDSEIEKLAKTQTTVAHCPSANLKLGSGIARIKEMLDKGVRVTLGADGAPCNNNLSIFNEMRLASLLQKVRHGAQALPAIEVLKMVTRDGAKALGLFDETGSIEVNKKADIVVLDAQKVWCTPWDEDFASAIVHSMDRQNCRDVLSDGRFVVRNHKILGIDEQELVREAKKASDYLFHRAFGSLA